MVSCISRERRSCSTHSTRAWGIPGWINGQVRVVEDDDEDDEDDDAVAEDDEEEGKQEEEG